MHADVAAPLPHRRSLRWHWPRCWRPPAGRLRQRRGTPARSDAQGMPAAQPVDAGAVRRDRGARGPRKPDGRRIVIFAAVLPANTLTPKDDPFVILAGGPGQAASHLAPFASRLTEIRRTRDIVLIDQRGTGRSSPLTCAAFKEIENEALETDPRAARAPMRGGAACTGRGRRAIHDHRLGRRSRGDARGAGLRPLEPVGWQLRHARRTGISAPASGPDPYRRARWGCASRDDHHARRLAHARGRPSAVFHACMDSAACRAAHPDAAATLRNDRSVRWVRRGRDVAIVDPRTGEPTRVHVTFDVVLGLLQPLLYAPDLSQPCCRRCSRSRPPGTLVRCWLRRSR